MFERPAPKKTVVRAIRITEELDRILREEADSKNISAAALVQSIFTRYVEWDRYTEKFVYYSIPADGFRGIIGAADEEQMVRVAEGESAKAMRAFSLFWFKEFNADTFLRGLAINSKYGRHYDCQISKNEKEATISIHHALGKKWSDVLSKQFGGALKMLGIIPQFDSITEESVVFRFPYRHKE
jgi:hypothetical protein